MLRRLDKPQSVRHPTTEAPEPGSGYHPAERAQVAIVGAGPSGMLLSHLLEREGVESVIVERRSAEHVAARVHAGVLESAAVEPLRQVGLGDRPCNTRSLQYKILVTAWFHC
jgi:p-hydroxybenzoate 3-monooxygenase